MIKKSADFQYLKLTLKDLFVMLFLLTKLVDNKLKPLLKQCFKFVLEKLVNKI